MARTPILNRFQRRMYAQKFTDLGNLAYGGLVIAQLVPGTEDLRTGLAIYGVIIFGIAYATAYFMTKGGDD